jgi:hypothetical protein
MKKQERAKLLHLNSVARAMDYTLKRSDAFTGYLSNGRICLNQPCGRARATRLPSFTEASISRR